MPSGKSSRLVSKIENYANGEVLLIMTTYCMFIIILHCITRKYECCLDFSIGSRNYMGVTVLIECIH